MKVNEVAFPSYYSFMIYDGKNEVAFSKLLYTYAERSFVTITI